MWIKSHIALGSNLVLYVALQRSNDENGNCSGGSMEFPTTNLYELESRVFTDHWSIPYKREESLGKCLIASTCLARHGKTMSSALGYRSPSALLCGWCVSFGVFHMLLFWTLVLYGTICSYFFSHLFSSLDVEWICKSNISLSARSRWCWWELQAIYGSVHARGL